MPSIGIINQPATNSDKRPTHLNAFRNVRWQFGQVKPAPRQPPKSKLDDTPQKEKKLRRIWPKKAIKNKKNIKFTGGSLVGPT